MAKQLFIAALVVASLAFAALARAATVAPPGPSLIVTLLQENFGGRAQVKLEAERLLKELVQFPRLRGVEPLFAGAERKVLDQLGQTGTAWAYLVHVESREDARAFEEWVHARKNMPPVSIERNAQADLHEAADPLLARQWGVRNRGASQSIALNDINFLPVPGRSGEDLDLPAVLAPVSPDRRVIVAILDTGIDATHPDLKSRVFRKEGECAALAEYKKCLNGADAAAKTVCDAKWAKTDTDGNGYPLDCVGWNVTGAKNPLTDIVGDPETKDDFGHGTHVAGVIGAEANSIGIQGASQGVWLLPVKVIVRSPNQPLRPQDDSKIPDTTETALSLEGANGGFVDVVARGMLYAIRSGAQVINMSLAWPAGADSLLMRRMIRLAQSRGILVVASSGNDSTDARVYPCQYAGVVCVASHGPDGMLSHFSNFGSAVEVAAPGLSILSTWPMNLKAKVFTEIPGYEYKNGTSMAAPAVAGLLATLRAAGIAPEEAKARLYASARPIVTGVPVGSLTGEPSKKYIAAGNVDLARAFSAAPRPWFERTRKEPVQLALVEGQTQYALSVSLRNIWGEAKGCAASAMLLDATAEEATVAIESAPASWSGASGAEAGALALKFKLAAGARGDLSGRLNARLTLSCGSGAQATVQNITVPIELAREISGASELPGSERLEVTGTVLAPSQLRTILDLSGRDRLDYLAMQKSGAEWKLQLIRDRGNAYRAGEVMTLVDPGGDLLLLQELDFDGKGESELVLVWRTPPQTPGINLPGTRFVVLGIDGEKIKVLHQFDYDNALSALPERFRWLRIDGETRVAWIGYGQTPPADLPPYDPWDPNPQDIPTNHLYLLGPTSGMHEIKAPADHFWLELLGDPARADFTKPVTALLGKGQNFFFEYFIGELAGNSLSNLNEWVLPEFQQLASLLNIIPSVSVASGTTSGVTFGTPDPRGRFRLTRWAPNAPTTQVALKPDAQTDSVSGTRAFFDDFRVPGSAQARSVTFVETHYDVRFRDLALGQEAAISLDRFSYLPSFITSRSLFPVIVKSGTGRQPGLLIPASLGSSISAEVIVPIYAANGTLVELRKPASLRLRAGDGCILLGNPRPATATRGSEWVLFCGSHFKRVPIAL